MKTAFAIVALALTPISIATPVMAADDPTFLADAIKGDNTEVAMGMMAEQRGASPKVRAYGTMLVHDHGEHRKKIAMLDHSMGILPTTELSDEGKQTAAMMRDLHGAKFDAAFKHHMIADHTQDIAKYEQAANTAQSPRLRMLAKETLPTLHKHLDHANAL